MRARLRIAEPVWERLCGYHLDPSKRTERLSYLWAHAYQDRHGNTTVVVPHNACPILFADDCYLRQSAGNCQLVPEVLNGMLVRFAASEYTALINIHDHWFDEITRFSNIDDADDLRFDRYLRKSFEPMLENCRHIGPSRPILNISVVLAQRGCDARVVDSRWSESFVPLTSVDVIASHLKRVFRGGAPYSAAIADAGTFARQRDFISFEKQQLLGDLTVALIGCGGLGSILAEDLARLGVGGLVLVDGDRLDATNLNRWQGATPGMVGKAKAHGLARRVRRMCPWIRISSLARSLYHTTVEQVIRGADIVVGAIDNDDARYFLNRLAVQYGMPYFDAGVAVSGTTDDIDFRSRYYAVIPGTSGCIECTQYTLFDRRKVLDIFLDPATRSARRAAGYVVDDDSISAPSVYALNQRAAGMLVTELLNYLCGFRPTATMISESWRAGSFQRADRANFPESPHPECPICGFYAGTADTECLPRPRESLDSKRSV